MENSLPMMGEAVRESASEQARDIIQRAARDSGNLFCYLFSICRTKRVAEERSVKCN
jgi:hypothetical protein